MGVPFPRISDPVVPVLNGPRGKRARTATLARMLCPRLIALRSSEEYDGDTGVATSLICLSTALALVQYLLCFPHKSLN